jgi:hypothetical protein
MNGAGQPALFSLSKCEVRKGKGPFKIYSYFAGISRASWPSALSLREVMGHQRTFHGYGRHLGIRAQACVLSTPTANTSVKPALTEDMISRQNR